jgi:anaerobic magnesium-protoporphyrin IX monomethyl ester cyclase
MRITLLHPATTSNAQAHRRGPGHLGLGYLAASLLQRGHTVRVLDAKNDIVTGEVLRQHLLEFQPELFGVTAMTHEIHTAAEACAIAKRVSPEIWTVIGGPHTTALPERTLEEFSSVDIAVAGEGEIAITELAEAKAGGAVPAELESILGLAYRAGDRVLRTGRRPWMGNLDDLPFPAWELFPKVSWGVISSRGCPFGCIFCQRVLGRQVRLRSVDNVLAEFDALEQRVGQREVWFRDETFGLNKRWLDEFLEKASARNRRKGYVCGWGCNSRANLADLDRYRRMKESGCHGVSFGVESGDEVILKRVTKGITCEMAIHAIATAQEAGLKAAAFFILGHPGETWRTAMKTVHLAAKSRANSIAVGVMVPYPGTEVWQMARAGEYGYKLLTEDWRAYDKFFGNALSLSGLSHRQLEFLQSLTYVWYYLYNLRFRNLLQFVSRFHSEAWAMLKRLLKPVQVEPAAVRFDKAGKPPAPATRTVA